MTERDIERLDNRASADRVSNNFAVSPSDNFADERIYYRGTPVVAVEQQPKALEDRQVLANLVLKSQSPKKLQTAADYALNLNDETVQKSYDEGGKLKSASKVMGNTLYLDIYDSTEKVSTSLRTQPGGDTLKRKFDNNGVQQSTDSYFGGNHEHVEFNTSTGHLKSRDQKSVSGLAQHTEWNDAGKLKFEEMRHSNFWKRTEYDQETGLRKSVDTRRSHILFADETEHEEFKDGKAKFTDRKSGYGSSRLEFEADGYHFKLKDETKTTLGNFADKLQDAKKRINKIWYGE